MRIAFLNPQGNFDPEDRYWTEHPDFGGQLVYVKEVALALGRQGHQVDIVTRRIIDPQWHGFEETLDGYPGEPNVRIVRLPCGGDRFLRKEALWPHLGTEWVPAIAAFFAQEDSQPEVATTHYGDGGLAGALWLARGGPPFIFTGHSLGAQKLDRLLEKGDTGLAELDDHYHFARRIAAERLAMNHAARIITSTRQERMEQYGHPAYEGAVDPGDDAKFAVVPPGVNLRIFDAGVEGPGDARIAGYLEEILARDIDGDRRALPAILCSSRLDPKKNHAGLVRALARSPQLQAAANLLIVVRGAEDIHSREGLTTTERAVLDEIVDLCNEHGLWGKVSAFSLASQQELASAYRYLAGRRSVFGLTALYEPFGLAPLEAIAAGLPAVVTRNGGPSESLYDAGTGQEYGILVDPTDPGDIAAGLLRLVGPENEWPQFRDAGRARVLARYTWERTAGGYIEVLQEVRAGQLAIPAYFWQPTPENDLGPAALAAWATTGS
ncbi:MAG: glycosyltransferase [Anaerolineae bacterium]|jgi:sucrose-phosphate synthase